MPTDDAPTKRSTALRESTGRDYDEWFRALDAWGAAGRPYAEIATWLTGEHGVSDWWAQKLIVEYEQDRGVRNPGARRDGTFSGGASKTIAAPQERVLAAFDDPDIRKRWLSGVVLEERPSQAAGTRRFDWPADGTRISVNVAATAAGKTTVAVEHERLSDSASAVARKAYWKARLTALQSVLEA
ncbi:MAG: hypothetical protein QOE66_1169 [Chloroflexota bacterium]|jgi:hypothetical protein|nr:hypothetical protein [Chloroflexota bacterium]